MIIKYPGSIVNRFFGRAGPLPGYEGKKSRFPSFPIRHFPIFHLSFFISGQSRGSLNEK